MTNIPDKDEVADSNSAGPIVGNAGKCGGNQGDGGSDADSSLGAKPPSDHLIVTEPGVRGGVVGGRRWAVAVAPFGYPMYPCPGEGGWTDVLSHATAFDDRDNPATKVAFFTGLARTLFGSHVAAAEVVPCA